MTSMKIPFFALALLLSATAALAIDNGVQRAADGTVQAVTAPVKIVEGVNDETRRNGPLAGAVVGTAKGSLNAAGAVIEGGAGIAIGVVEAGVGVVKRVVQPLTGP